MNRDQIDDIYELSPMQEGMLFHSLCEPERGLYLVQVRAAATGPLDPEAFRRAWQEVCERHPILRTSFHWQESEKLLQVVHKRVVVPVEQHDWRALGEEDRRARLQAHLDADRARGFDFAAAPLLRVALFRRDELTWDVLWTFHHLLLDGWSFPIVFRDVLAAYERGAGAGPAPAGGPPYRRYIDWLRRQDLGQAEAFWRGELAGFGAATPVPEATAGGGDGDPPGDVQVKLSSEVSAQLRAFARAHQLTLNTVVQGAWTLLLAAYGGQDDVVFGCVVGGRPPSLADVDEIVGPFINTLPARIRVERERPLAAWLAEIQRAQSEARHYDYTPLSRLSRWIGGRAGEPLFRTVVAFQNYPYSRPASAKAAVTWRLLGSRADFNHPIGLEVGPGELIALQLLFDGHTVGRAGAERILRRLERLLAAIPSAGALAVGALSILSEDERRQIVFEWNDTSVEFPRELCVQQLFESRCARQPTAPAVRFGPATLSYQELNRRANHLAWRLRERGVGPEGVVGIWLERSAELIVAMLAVLKAGAAYLPLDPSYPKSRLELMVADSRCCAVVTGPGTTAGGALAGQVLLVIDEGVADDDPPCTTVPTSNAYVMYTSGSAGTPKGICIPHRAILRLVCNTDYVHFRPDDVIAQASNASFDAATFEIWGALLNGISCVGVPKDVLLSPARLGQQIEASGITTLFVTTAVFHQLAAEAPEVLARLRWVLTGGERMDPAAMRTLLGAAGPAQLLHVYGPTETTTFATAHPVAEVAPGARSVPIGRPIANTQGYVVDARGGLLPVGVPGELWIGGEGVATAYLGHPALTAERFVPDPFSGRPGARLYRTGDLVRWLSGGALDFLGRIDGQVKIRGFRIEPAEIEAALCSHPDVREAVVLVTEPRPGERRLDAYARLEPGRWVEVDRLRAHLAATLPEHMVPASIVAMESFPLNANGKVDRAALPRPSLVVDGPRERQGPRDELERALVEIWEETLGVDPIGIDDNFFELGGHSILAMRLVASIHRRLGLSAPISQLLRATSIRRLAETLRADDQEPRPAVVPLGASKARPPLFCVHPGSGNVLCYTALARELQDAYRVYGIQDPRVNDDPGRNRPGDFDVPIEAMAAEYVRELRRAEREGPYVIVGWSFGAHVAFEMVRILRQQGQEVQFLALLDGAAPDLVRTFRRVADDSELLATIGREMGLALTAETFRHLPPAKQVEHVAGLLGAAGVVPSHEAVDWTAREVEIFKARLRVLGAYHPAPARG
jgi:amino acid adenylation domain-containing protein